MNTAKAIAAETFLVVASLALIPVTAWIVFRLGVEAFKEWGKE